MTNNGKNVKRKVCKHGEFNCAICMSELILNKEDDTHNKIKARRGGRGGYDGNKT